jgi:type VI secretion system protein ImpF
MPPTPTPQQGLKPSLVDRLIDPESAGTAIMLGYTPAKMYDAVLRDLEDLLNTRQTYRDMPAGYPEAMNSILGYGLPDLASVEVVGINQRSEIARAIRQIIERFEPRLNEVAVVLLNPGENHGKQSLRFRVDARLAVDPSPDVAFDTILEIASGHYVVTPAADV